MLIFCSARCNQDFEDLLALSQVQPSVEATKSASQVGCSAFIAAT
jgi:chromate transport protein ChrA